MEIEERGLEGLGFVTVRVGSQNPSLEESGGCDVKTLLNPR